MADAALMEPASARRIGLTPIVGFGLAVILLFFVGFGTWAALAPLDSAAIAPGVVSPDTQRKTVQHLEGGIVEQILVREGQHIEAGQLLVRLSPVQPDADLGQLRLAYNASGALAARLVTERDSATEIAFPDWLLAVADDPQVTTLMINQVDVFDARRQAHADGVPAVAPGVRPVLTDEHEVVATGPHDLLRGVARHR